MEVVTDKCLISKMFCHVLYVHCCSYETTSSSLAFIVRMLVRYPEVQERLRSELLEATGNGNRFDFERLQKCHYLEAVIQETLRMYPPIYGYGKHSNLKGDNC